MSTLTTIRIITKPNSFLQTLPPQPFIRFFGKIQSYDARTGILLVQELPAFMVDFDNDGTDTQAQSLPEEVLPVVKISLPPTGLDLSRDTILQQLVVSVMGFLQLDQSVTAQSISPLSNQQLFDLGYEDDMYSSTVLEKIQVSQHIAQY